MKKNFIRLKGITPERSGIDFQVLEGRRERQNR